MNILKLSSIALIAGITSVSCKGKEDVVTEETSNERNFLYFDATANFARFTHKDSITYYLQKAKDVGVTDVVIDVKPITGEVLFPSQVAPVMTAWEGEYESGKKDMSWDMLSVFIEEGHQRGLS